MQDWKEVEKRIKSKLTPQHRGILTYHGNARRKIVSNDGQIIRMWTGKNNTKPIKPITYQMIKYAFDRLRGGCIFNSPYFRLSYEREYRNGSCRYSMVGGILVELKLATRHRIGKKSCYYVPIWA